MVMSWIVEKSIGDSFVHANSAREMWIEVEKTYGQANGPLPYQV